MLCDNMRLLWNEVTLFTVVHMLAGIITILAIQVSFVVPFLLFCGFMIYELNEDWHLGDGAYRDILEYDVGMFVGVLILIIRVG